MREDSVGTGFRVGNAVGEVARRLYDPKGKGILVDPKTEGFSAALQRSKSLLDSSQPIFEAGFAANGASAFADVMLPVTKKGRREWRMVEVKSSTKVKDYHRSDISIQAFVAKAAGVPLASISVATIDSAWVYAGDDKYKGLLKESNLTEEVLGREDEADPSGTA